MIFIPTGHQRNRDKNKKNICVSYNISELFLNENLTGETIAWNYSLTCHDMSNC